MRKQSTREHGFTLIELLVATAVTGILLVIIMTFMVNTIAQGAIDTARANLLQHAQFALDTAAADIRLSASAEEHNRYADPYAPNASSGDEYSWTSDNSTTVILATAARTKTGDNVIFQDTQHYISYKNNNIYYLKDGTLYRRVLAAPVSGNRANTTCPPSNATSTCPADSVLVDHVSGFSITYYNGNDQVVTPDNARSVEIHIQLQTTKYDRVIKADYTTRTVFRND